MNLAAASATLRRLADQVDPVPGSIRLEADRLVIDDPDARGALTVGMMAELAAIVTALVGTERPWIRIQSVGDGCFCSGGHLVQVRGALGTSDAGLQMSRAMTVVLDALASLPCLVIAELDGPALGGGAELLTACDLVVAGPRARIGFVQGSLGITTGWGGAVRLGRRVGPSSALRILALGGVLGPQEAVQQGLIDVLGEALVPTVDHTLARLDRASPAALRGFKRVLAPPDRSGVEAEVFGSLWGGSDHVARLAATKRTNDPSSR